MALLGSMLVTGEVGTVSGYAIIVAWSGASSPSLPLITHLPPRGRVLQGQATVEHGTSEEYKV